MKTKLKIRIFYRNIMGWLWFPLHSTLQKLLDNLSRNKRTIKYE